MTTVRPGDRVKCVDAWPHCWTLRLSNVYTVDCVSEDGRMIGLADTMARMWSVDQFVPVETDHAAPQV